MTLGRIWLLTAGVFALDLPFPVGYAVPLLYIPLIVATLRITPHDHARLVATVASVLTIAEAVLVHNAANLELGLFNRGLALVALWITAAGVSRHRRLQEALRRQAADAELGRMTAVMAHELRNPLAGVRGGLQVLEVRLGDDARATIVSEMRERLDRLAGIVEALLRFVRPAAAEPQSIRVATVFEEAQAVALSTPALSKLTVSASCDEGVLVADRAQLLLVLVELLKNAAHPSTGASAVTLSGRHLNGRWRIQVTDNGRGVEAADRARLGEPFFTTKADGPGLGLATARRLLGAQGGTLTFEFPETGGTVALIDIPG